PRSAVPCQDLIFLIILLIAGWAALSGGPFTAADEPSLTFLVTSDSHYEAVTKVERNDRNRVTIARMNELPGQSWPEKLGGGTIGQPRGVLALGDLIDDGDKRGETDIEWQHFTDHFGLDGTDGLLKYPVFEGWGNHDGPPDQFIKQRVSVQAEIKRQNLLRLEKKLIANVSPNGLHYSWDWNGIHFIQTNLYPADKQNAKVRYSLPWHDPQLALQFVRDDLEKQVGESGRPVIIMAHCGFDTDWWVVDDWTAFYQAIKPYNVIAYFHGHTGTGVKSWKPAGESKSLDVINTGQTEKGFFVVEVSATRLRLAYHVKQDSTVVDQPQWDWKYLFEKPLQPAAPAAPEKNDPQTSAPQPATGTSATARRPNILLIVADDLGWSDVGWHGGFGKTPTLDRLVREGVELDQHYVQPVCTPTRVALLSGRYPGRFGPQALAPSNLRAMPLGTETLASTLRSLGYRTHLAGKWHLGARPEWIPNAYGFQTSYGTLTGAADPWTHKYRRGNPYEDTWHRDGKRLQEEGNATELIAAEALQRIEADQGPWFVYVPFHAVHTPVDAPAQYKRLYDGFTFHDDPAKQDSRLRLAAMIAQLDDKVGQFVAALERTGQREHTLIIFTSDNGGIESLKNDYAGDVGHSPLNSENDPLRGQKATLYEGGTRVAAFANWPAKLRPYKFTTAMHCVDWFPTLAELVGYRPTPELQWDGVSHWSALASAQQNPLPRSIYIASTGPRSLRRGDWKLIEFAGGRRELFNLRLDPYEKQNLAGEEPDRVTELSQLLVAERRRDLPQMPADLEGLPH
ncbi:MAG: sulfatase-like hydrolase/transferase, partial [Planctomycetota bacterium]